MNFRQMETIALIFFAKIGWFKNSLLSLSNVKLSDISFEAGLRHMNSQYRQLFWKK